MYSTRTAYLLWLASFFGVSGLHRLYMGKIGTGILFLVTMGLGGLGTIYDGITMPNQIREARLKARMRRALDDRLDEMDELEYTGPRRPRTDRPGHGAQSPEHVILQVAKNNHGIANPAQVALEGSLSTDEAREHLDQLVNKGIGEVRVRKSGTLAYVFPDFLDDTGAADLESF